MTAVIVSTTTTTTTTTATATASTTTNISPISTTSTAGGFIIHSTALSPTSPWRPEGTQAAQPQKASFLIQTEQQEAFPIPGARGAKKASRPPSLKKPHSLYKTEVQEVFPIPGAGGGQKAPRPPSPSRSTSRDTGTTLLLLLLLGGAVNKKL